MSAERTLYHPIKPICDPAPQSKWKTNNNPRNTKRNTRPPMKGDHRNNENQ